MGVDLGRKSKENRPERFQPDCLQVPRGLIPLLIFVSFLVYVCKLLNEMKRQAEFFEPWRFMEKLTFIEKRFTKV